MAETVALVPSTVYTGADAVSDRKERKDRNEDIDWSEYFRNQKILAEYRVHSWYVGADAP